MSRLTLMVLFIIGLSFVAVSAWSSPLTSAPLLPPRQVDIPLQTPTRYDKTVEGYPSIDSLTVEEAVHTTDSGDLIFYAYVTNPATIPFSGLQVDLSITDPISGHRQKVVSDNFDIPAATSIVQDIPWSPEVSLPSLQYDVDAMLSLPIDKSQINLVTNGTFDSGCGGWNLQNNNPPALGSTCTFGYMHTFSSTYNTTDGNQTLAYTTVDLGTVSPEALTLQMVAKFHTESGIYGEGECFTWQAFYDSTGAYLGSCYQIAFNGGLPSDTGTEHYGLVQQNVWIGFNTPVTNLLDSIPDVSVQDVRYMNIGTGAQPVCYMPYCSPSSYVDIDDVALTTGVNLVSFTHQPVVISDLSSNVIGDRQQMLLDCYGGNACSVSIGDIVPLSGPAEVVGTWDRLRYYTCAAGIHQEEGDEFQRDAALFMGITSVYTEMLSSSYNAWESVGSALLSWSGGPVQRALACAGQQLSLATTKTNDLSERVSAYRNVIKGYGDDYRCIAIVSGDAAPAVVANEATTTRSTAGHLGAFVLDYPDSVHSLTVIGDTLTSMATGSVITPADPVDLKFPVRSTGPLMIATAIRDLAGVDSVLTYPELVCPAGAELTLHLAPVMGSFTIDIDWTADGVADSTLAPLVVTSVLPVKPIGVITGFKVAPNPSNPSFHLDLSLSSAAVTEVSVFDLRGKRIARIWQGLMQPGRQDLVWDGKDDQGQAQATGVYLVNARAGNENRTIRLTLVR